MCISLSGGNPQTASPEFWGCMYLAISLSGGTANRVAQVTVERAVWLAPAPATTVVQRSSMTVDFLARPSMAGRVASLGLFRRRRVSASAKAPACFAASAESEAARERQAVDHIPVTPPIGLWSLPSKTQVMVVKEYTALLR